MPYLVKVGIEKNNLHLLTSKGYFIKRIGNKIHTELGAIDVVGLKRKKFAWHKSTQTKVFKFKTTKAALEFKNYKIENLIWKGYTKIPASSRIYRRKVY